jgi:LmbE family N-acetylglucosaminyl deacetylase
MRSFLCALTLTTLFAADPLPEDRGAAGLHQAMKRLATDARVLYITAHPDDEDGGAITWLTRGQGVHVTLLSLTRGEAGANLVTSDFFDSLGALRTLELTKAAQYYGARLRFTSFADYGYSKNVAEAWRNWDRDKLLQDVLRIVQEEKPHIIMARWQGTPRDGHGHHEAAGVIAQLAFHAAEKQPGAWLPLKIYSGNRRENEDWTIRVDSGIYDPVLGRSYAQIARDGLRWQRSQGAGSVVSRPGAQISYYKLLASRVGMAVKENSIFERIEDRVKPAHNIPLNAGARQLAEALAKNPDSRLSRALELALGLELEALVQPDQPVTGPFSAFRPYETFQLATPGRQFEVAATFHNRGAGPVTLENIELSAPPGWQIQRKSEKLFQVKVADHAAPTKAFWQRDSVRDLQYRTLDPALYGQPLPPPPLTARATYRVHGVQASIEREVLVSRIDSIGVQHLRPLAVGPALSVRFDTDHGVLPITRNQYEVVCLVRNLTRAPITGTLRLEVPAGWRSDPPSSDVTFAKENEESTVRFRLTAPSPSGEHAIQAVLTANGRHYRAAFLPYTYTGLDTVWMEKPAVHRVRGVDVKVAANLKAGYVMGTGDEVPATLRQLGVEVEMLDSEALARGDLTRFHTILLGIRAYAAREDVKTYNARLLDFVERGGTLIVQYNTPEYDNNYGPFPYRMGRNPEEVSEENSPVRIIAPEDPVFETPNRITPADFDGWIEQRGSKFLAEWDPRYKPLLETQDTGQTPQRGGWLVARHGKGLYIYCAYAWYRQLPFAVPGAVRLFANLVSASATAR